MILCYELSMPGSPSWNGKWSGEGRCFAIIRSYRGKAREEKWNDGWCAKVSVRKVDNKEAARMRRKTIGFAAYDWMVDSIERNGVITTD